MSVDRARLWMRKAENDLLAADNNLASRRIPCDVVCFHCQQAAEKLLKGLLLSLGAQPLRTHDLLALLEEARRRTSIPVPDAVASACVILNPYSVEVRYPDDDWMPTLDDAREARQAAECVLVWIREMIPS